MKSNIYKNYVFIYNNVHNSDFHKRYVFFIKKIISENKIRKVKLLDLACGTGKLISELKSACQLIEGADKSAEMLKIAKSKNKKIKFYNQDFLNLNTGKKYNIITSTFDSINYLTKEKELTKAFKKIYLHLGENGIFFDFNTIYKKLPKEMQRHNVVYRNRIKNKFWHVDIEFKKGNKVFKENHKERLFSIFEIASALKKSDLNLIGIYSSFDKRIKKPKKEPRLFVVAKK